MTPTILTDKVELLADELQVTVLAIGPWSQGEFHCALSQIMASRHWNHEADIDAALVSLESGATCPELILLAQPTPGASAAASVANLQKRAPLARIVVVAGTWCEGEIRTGKPLPGVLRLYWYELAGWWYRAIGLLKKGEIPTWSVPPDGLIAGRCRQSHFVTGENSFSNNRDPEVEILSGEVAIDCSGYSTFEALATAFACYGAQCYWLRRGSATEWPTELVAGIWDGGQLDPPEIKRLREFSTEVHHRGGVCLALLDFPRREHLATVPEAGCEVVLGKPYVVEELVALLVDARSRAK